MMMPDRSGEIRELFGLSVEEMVERTGNRLVVKETLDELYEYLADEMVREFQKAADSEKPLAFIMPVGPVQPYKIMAEKINSGGVSLKNCWMFFMDEYCDDDDNLLPVTHPLSFRGQSRKLFFDLLDRSLIMPEEQIVFPEPENLHRLPEMIGRLGGIEVCYGGIGIHGHVAFNEPAEGVKDTDPRFVDINDFTRTVDSSRNGCGGNLVNFPRRAVSLGMKQCLGARRILLMTRNEHKGMDWCNTALRISVLGVPGDDYPATYIRSNPDWTVATDRASASAPRIII